MDLTALLLFHITAGGFALASGATALFAHKGGGLHRTAGNVFFISMLLMATVGAVMAVLKPAAAALNVIVAAITAYMVVTSWMTVQRQELKTGPFMLAALFVALAVTIGALMAGFVATTSLKGTIDGIPPFLFFGFAGVAALAALADLSVIARGGVSGAQRIARHLWRMGFALFLACLAFFVGQGAKAFPPWVREANVLPAPMIVVLIVTLFWLSRVLLTNWAKRDASAAPIPAAR
jgi:hypothetical protein